jgi:hypothetical protein
MRPTPTSIILPTLVKELIKYGIKKNNINIVIASGSHAKSKKEDIIKKVGKKLFKELKIVPHNEKSKLSYIGITNTGVKIYINDIVAKAEVKIGISGIYPHPEAGFSGGAKIIAPGICGFETICKLHNAIMPARTQGEINNDLRKEITKIAQIVGLDYSINVILTPERKVGELFAGDMIEAFNHSIYFFKNKYQVKIIKDVDIIVSNAYPFDGSDYFFSRGFWPLWRLSSPKMRVLIVNGSMSHKKYPFKIMSQSKSEYLFQTIKKLLSTLLFITNPKEIILTWRKTKFFRQPRFLMYYTGNVSVKEFSRRWKGVKIFNNWKILIKELEKSNQNKKIKVAIYPYAGLQYA